MQPTKGLPLNQVSFVSPSGGAQTCHKIGKQSIMWTSTILYCIVLLKFCVLYDNITATLAGTLVPVNVLLRANWRGNTTEFTYSPPSANFKPTNPTLHGQIWLWPELSELLAVDASGKSMPCNCRHHI
ncbi:hypothetical protein B0H14DRAFT_2595842 [Mycena olivaceomarginata]|nr:hypothetical protein B0H14DRAFT_2595842 [Mycena olivaceomarginata]